MDRRGFLAGAGAFLTASVAGCTGGSEAGTTARGTPSREKATNTDTATPTERGPEVSAALTGIRRASAALSEQVEKLPPKYGKGEADFRPEEPMAALDSALESLSDATGPLATELRDSVRALQSMVGLFDAYAGATTAFVVGTGELESDAPAAARDAFATARTRLETATDYHENAQRRYREIETRRVPETGVPIEPMRRDISEFASRLPFARALTKGHLALAEGYVAADRGERKLQTEEYEAAADAFETAFGHFSRSYRVFERTSRGTKGERRGRLEAAVCKARSRRKATKHLQGMAEALAKDDGIEAREQYEEAKDAVGHCPD